MLPSVETYNPAKAIEYWNNCVARSKRPNFLESTNSTTAKSVSNLQIVKAPISDSNENHIDNVEFEEVIALSDPEYSDTDSPSESVDFDLCLMNLLMTLLVTWNNCINCLF